MYRDDNDRERAPLEAVEQYLSEALRMLSGLRERGEPPLEWLTRRADSLSRATRLFREQVQRAAEREGRPRLRGRALPWVLLAGSVGLGVLAGGLACGHRHRPPPLAASSPQVLVGVPAPPPAQSPADAQALLPAPAPATPATADAPAAPPDPPALAVSAPDRGLSAADYDRLLALSRGFFRTVRARNGAGLAGVSHPVFGLHVVNMLADADQPQRDFEPVETRQCFQPPGHEDCVPCGCSPLCSDAVAPFGALPFEKATSVTFNEPQPDVATDEWRAWATFTLTNPVAAPGAAHETVMLRFEQYDGRWWVGAAVRRKR